MWNIKNLWGECLKFTHGLSFKGRKKRSPNSSISDEGSSNETSQERSKGLLNSNNYCYLNSVTMSLFYTKRFAYSVLFPKRKKETSILQGELYDVFKKLNDPSITAVDPKSFYDTFQKSVPHFEYGQQEDAQEALLYLLNDIDPKLKDLFECELSVKRKCKECGKTSKSIEKHLCLSFPLSEVSTTEKIVEEYFEDTDIDMWCSSCRKQTVASQNIRLVKEPEYLIMHLIRYQFLNNTVTKNKIEVDINDKIKFGKHQYKPYSIVNHHGCKPSSGHYTATCLNKYDEWLKFNDERVTQSREMEKTDSYLVFLERENGKGRANGKH